MCGVAERVFKQGASDEHQVHRKALRRGNVARVREAIPGRDGVPPQTSETTRLNNPVPLPGSEQEAHSPASFRCGYVAIIGKPNVGKSTLMNALIGQKISIVTPKPQTTRHKILGIRTRELDQIIFLDTPGLMKPEYPLHDAMMEAARSAIVDADVAVLMIDAMSPGRGEDIDAEPAFSLLRACRAPVFLVINKLDLVKPERMLPVIASYAEKQLFKEIYPVSALKQIGTEELLNGLSAELPVHPAYYPAEIVSEHSERFFVAELIRGKIFEK